MNREEVQILVREEIGERWDESIGHKVNLRESLIEPEKVTLIERTVEEGNLKDSLVEGWLVLEENPEKKNGYKIVLSGDGSAFGIASKGFENDEYLVLTGWYGDFWKAFHGM